MTASSAGQGVGRGEDEDRPGAPPADDTTWVRDHDDRLVARDDPEPLAAAVSRRVGQRSGWEDRLEGAAIFSRWEQIVGSQMAGRCRPVRLAGGRLVVAVPTQAWATEIGYLAGHIIQRADEELGSGLVREVQVVVRPQQDQSQEDEGG